MVRQRVLNYEKSRVPLKNWAGHGGHRISAGPNFLLKTCEMVRRLSCPVFLLVVCSKNSGIDRIIRIRLNVWEKRLCAGPAGVASWHCSKWMMKTWIYAFRKWSLPWRTSWWKRVMPRTMRLQPKWRPTKCALWCVHDCRQDDAGYACLNNCFRARVAAVPHSTGILCHLSRMPYIKLTH